MSSKTMVVQLSDKPLPREEVLPWLKKAPENLLPREEVLPWLKKAPAELRAEERQLVEVLASSTGAPKRDIRTFVRSFMKK